MPNNISYFFYLTTENSKLERVKLQTGNNETFTYVYIELKKVMNRASTCVQSQKVKPKIKTNLILGKVDVP